MRLRVRARRTVFDGVADQVLEELSESRPVGTNDGIRLDSQRSVGRLDVAPAVLGERREVDRFDVQRRIAFPCDRQDVLDQDRHAVVRPRDGLEIVVAQSQVSRAISSRPCATFSGLRRSWETMPAKRSSRSFCAFSSCSRALRSVILRKTPTVPWMRPSRPAGGARCGSRWARVRRRP